MLTTLASILMKKLLLLLGCYLIFASHELFLKTDAYYLSPNQACELYLFNGTFDESENVITRDRIVKAKIIGPSYDYAPETSDYYDKELSTHLKFKSGEEGTYLAGISTLPRIIDLSAKDFEEYLIHEGLTDLLAEREIKGIMDSDATEEYSKHVKAILQVGEKRTKHFSTNLGYPIEFIPLVNPYEIKVGDAISFQLLSEGKPLSNQVVHYSFRTGEENESKEKRTTRTGEDGKVSFIIDAIGKWYISTIYIVEMEQSDLDYESNWATLTFEVR